MSFLNRLLARFRGAPPQSPPQTPYDEVLEERILTSPDERTQLDVTSEGERAARLDDGRPQAGPDR